MGNFVKGVKKIFSSAGGGGSSLSGLTTGYLTKATSSTTIGNSVVYESSGNIGIGTSLPSYKLHIKGDDITGVSIKTESLGSSWGGGISINNGTKSHFIAQGGNDYNNSLFIRSNIGTYITQFDENGNVRIGYPTLSAIDSITSRLYVKGIDATSSNYAFKADNSASSPLLYVRNDAFVGIGTATPTSKLHVVGLSTYADNAAAVTAGLTAGAFYIRTGHGLDVVV